MNEEIKIYDNAAIRSKYLTEKGQAQFHDWVKGICCFELEAIIPLVKYPIPPSRAESANIFFVTSGTFKMKVGFEEYVLSGNQVLILQPGKIFSFEGYDADIKGFSCHFTPAILVENICSQLILEKLEVLEIWSSSKLVVPDEMVVFLTNYFKRIIFEYNKKDPDLDLINVHLMSLLFDLKCMSNISEVGLNSNALNITREFKKEIFKNINQAYSVLDFAGKLNITPNYLNRCVKKITGESASILIDRMKLIEAKYLLCQTKKAIGDVASEVGYFDQSHFSRYFKKYEGKSPTEFKKQLNCSKD